MKHIDPTAIRLQLLASGYTPIPNHDKVPALVGWNAADYAALLRRYPTAAAAIASWARRFPSARSTGVRIERGLAAIDADVDDDALVGQLWEIVDRIAPGIANQAPARYGGGEHKVAWFARLTGEQSFVRRGSRRYAVPAEAAAWHAAVQAWRAAGAEGSAPAPPNSHRVEIFGGAPTKAGACSRQFGVDGPHTTVGGEVRVRYRWAEGPSLAATPLGALPALTLAQAEAIIDAFDAAAIAAGWAVLTEADEGDGNAHDVYDIDPVESRFEVVGEAAAVDYAGLAELLATRGQVRLSANFIPGEASQTVDRCSVFWSQRYDCAVVKDWKTGARHYPQDLAPAPPDDTLAPALTRLAEAHGIAPPTPVPNWRERYANGVHPKASLHNTRLAIEALGIQCSWDTFHNKLWIGRCSAASPREPRLRFLGLVDDPAIGALRVHLSNTFGFDPTEKHVRDAVNTLCQENRFDPVVDMLAEAQASWDGQPRLDRLAMDYFHAADTTLNRAFLRKTLIAAVARARQPGCKFDTMLMLEAEEGYGKSTSFLILAGEDSFSDESIIGKESREVQEHQAGVWIHENAELGGMVKREVEAVAAYCSRQTDRARPAFGHFLVEQPRHSIEIGTTNETTGYLQKQTGNRRFWPLSLTRPIELKRLKADRLQLWGEAAHYQAQGESLLLPEALWQAARAQQELRRAVDPWEDVLGQLAPTTSAGPLAGVGLIGNAIVHCRPGFDFVFTLDIFEHTLRKFGVHLDSGSSRRLANVMRRLGWAAGKDRLNGVQLRGYRRTTPERGKNVKDRFGDGI